MARVVAHGIEKAGQDENSGEKKIHSQVLRASLGKAMDAGQRLGGGGLRAPTTALFRLMVKSVPRERKPADEHLNV